MWRQGRQRREARGDGPRGGGAARCYTREGKALVLPLRLPAPTTSKSAYATRGFTHMRVCECMRDAQLPPLLRQSAHWHTAACTCMPHVDNHTTLGGTCTGGSVRVHERCPATAAPSSKRALAHCRLYMYRLTLYGCLRVTCMWVAVIGACAAVNRAVEFTQGAQDAIETFVRSHRLGCGLRWCWRRQHVGGGHQLLQRRWTLSSPAN